MMWGYFDGVYAMDPAWLEHWNLRYYILELMGQMKPPHITEEARTRYYTYISDQMQYMCNYLYSGQVQDYAVYQAHLQTYRESNPEGAKVYDKQETYLFSDSKKPKLKAKKKSGT